MSDEMKTTVREENAITRWEENVTTKIFGKFNKVVACGQIEDELEFSHEVLWENFYKTRVKVKRSSCREDFVPIIVSELLVEQHIQDLKDKWVEIAGQFRSRNELGNDGRNHLCTFLFVTAINIYENKEDLKESERTNQIYLNGYICQSPRYKKISQEREKTEFLIAVGRAYEKSDYIPCLVWGRTAQWAKNLIVSDRVELYGRIQSREFYRRISKDSEEFEKVIAYEVSIQRIKKVE